MEKVTDPDVEQSIRNKDNSVDTIKIFLSKEQQKIDELKKEHDQIILYCAEFAAFLANNSILPYNDSYGQYVEHMIKEEEDKVKEGGGKDVLDNLKKYKDQYDQQVKILTENMNAKARSVKSVEEINAMVAGLSKLKHCGSTIEEIKKIQLHSCHQSSVEMGKKVQIGRKSNFGNPFKKLINRN
uniref:Uncharacterized protein n=1 Tax=Plectus sambesii TaxID=2011161 RepID=A0A914V8I0_9BILA